MRPVIQRDSSGWPRFFDRLTKVAGSAFWSRGTLLVVIGGALVALTSVMIGDQARHHMMNASSLALLVLLVMHVVRVHRRSLGWWMIVAALLCFLGAQVAGGADGYAAPASQAASGAAYLALGTGVLLILRAGLRVLVDVVLAGAVLAFPLIALFGLIFCPKSPDPDGAYTLVTYVLLDVMLIGVPLVVIGQGLVVRSRFAMRLAVSAAALVVADASMAIGVALGHFHEPGPLPQTAWFVSGAILVLAASVKEPFQAPRVAFRSPRAVVAPVVLSALAWVGTAELALRSGSLGVEATVRLSVGCAAVILICFALRLACARRDLTLAEQAETLEADRLRMTMRYGVGRATLGIAHDLSNVAWTQSLATASARSTIDAGLLPRQEIIEITGTTETLKRITERLRWAVSTDAHLPSRPVDIGEASERVAALMRRRWPDLHSIKVMKLASPVVVAPPSTIDQILINVASNAAQAAGLDGNVRIVIDKVDLDVEIFVQDDGPGIPEDARGRIFAPFFSTRVPDGGQGLGLSIVQAAVAELGGDIELVSLKDPTSFRIRIPMGSPGA